MSASHCLFPVCNEISREISKWGTLSLPNTHEINKFEWPKSCISDFGSDGTTARRLSPSPIYPHAKERRSKGCRSLYKSCEKRFTRRIPCPSINRRQPKNKQTLRPSAHSTQQPKPQQKTLPNLCPTSQKVDISMTWAQERSTTEKKSATPWTSMPPH